MNRQWIILYTTDMGKRIDTLIGNLFLHFAFAPLTINGMILCQKRFLRSIFSYILRWLSHLPLAKIDCSQWPFGQWPISQTTNFSKIWLSKDFQKITYYFVLFSLLAASMQFWSYAIWKILMFRFSIFLCYTLQQQFEAWKMSFLKSLENLILVERSPTWWLTYGLLHW